MAEEIMPEEHKNLRAYILHEVGEKERQIIEERLVTDEFFFRELLVVEEMVVQDYADGKLTQAQRARFEKCFLISKENHRKVRFARALRKCVDEIEDAGNEKKPTFFESLKGFFLSPVPAAIAALIILSLGGFWIWKSSDKNRTESLVALNEAFRAERPFEARITDLDYAPTKNTRGSNDEKTKKLKLDLAARIALEDADKNASAENLHALGRVYLTEKKFDEAIGQLEKAAKLAPDNAKLHNDLGAALLEKAKVTPEEELLTFGKANEEFSKAIELDKNLLDSYFNRALTVQNMNLPNEAREAWQKYLELDPDSKWSEEAKKHLETLDLAKPLGKNKEAILQEFIEAEKSRNHERAWQALSRTREIPDKLIHQQIIFLFVDAKANGDELKAKESLNSLIYAGKLEKERSGDLYWRDLADYYQRVTDDKIPRLKEAQDYVRQGYQQWSKRELGKSSESFQTAIGLFTKADNNLETKICEYLILNTLFQFNKIKESNDLYLKLAESSQSQQYKWLATQSYTRLAYGTGSENKLSNSIEYINKALELAKQTDDSYNLQRLFSLLGDRYRQLGRFDLSLKYSEQSLEIANQPEASRRQTWTDYEVATQTFFAKHFFKTAVIFQKEALKLSRDIEVRYFEQLSNSYIGMLYSADNKFAEAEPFFLESVNIAETFEDEQVRTKNLALARLKYADFKRDSGKYDEALALYDEVSGFHSSSEFQREKYACQKGKLLCYIQMRNDAAVQEQLPVMLEIFKNYRGKIFEEQNRNAFFDRNQDVYDTAVNYEYDKANYEKAFNYSEDSRSRSLLDLINSNETISNSDSESAEIKFLKPSSEPLKISEIQPQIPEQVQLLQYNVLKDKIIIWLITGKDFQPVHTEIDIKELQDTVFSYLNLLKNQEDADKEDELSRRLYQVLIAPIEGKLDGSKKICLIPDKFLFHLPFAALISEKTDRYLVYDYEIFYAPSANVFLLNTDEARKHKSDLDEILLSIGNPAFSQKSFPDLPKLASAEKEVAEVDGFYKNPIPLVGQAASKENVEQNFTKSNVIHFAGHYVVNEQNSALSGFLLAENGSFDKQGSLLTSSEILNIKLPNTKLIVLSACQTGVEGFYQGEGIIGAARTFLANKVPLVVASQWAVDSESTKNLMVSFHRYRKRESLSTATALRKAQLEMLDAQDRKFHRPYFWAGFMTLGGYAEF